MKNFLIRNFFTQIYLKFIMRWSSHTNIFYSYSLVLIMNSIFPTRKSLYVYNIYVHTYILPNYFIWVFEIFKVFQLEYRTQHLHLHVYDFYIAILKQGLFTCNIFFVYEYIIRNIIAFIIDYSFSQSLVL